MPKKYKMTKKVEKLLNRRAKLAWELIGCSGKLDEYCMSLGIFNIDEAALCTNQLIYTEPNEALKVTKKAILNRLEELNNNINNQ